MSEGKKGKVLHVDKLIIHAKEVEIIQEHKDEETHKPREVRDPWGFFWGRPRPDHDFDKEKPIEDDKDEHDHH